MLDLDYQKLFNHVVYIWINKPQVIHKKIFAARIFDNISEDQEKLSRCLFLKNESKYLETIKIKDNNQYEFKGEDAIYIISLMNKEINVTTTDNSLPHSLFPCQWLTSELFNKLNRWFQQECLEPSLKSIPSSLSTIDIEFYLSTQNRLKKIYGKQLCENWSERTDPAKFVYEDISIAAYLISLWKDEDKESLYFIDIGCGNGLLVYLLISEGFAGHGVDIRERGIWKTFPENVRFALKEETFVPSESSLFPSTVTWLIGNHSDELTPWIPVMATKSSSFMKVFLLPCCSFDFHCKFDAGGRTTSRYRAYLNFIDDVMKKCGFDTKEDLLRIPSTKRICFVGYPNYNEEDRDTLLKQIDELILSRSKHSNSNPSSERKRNHSSDELHEDDVISEGEVDFDDRDDAAVPFHPNFKPRDKEIITRNCTSIDISLREKICNVVFNRLLQDESWITTDDGRQWNQGGELHLTKVSELFDYETLQKLKSENGGIGTLLKNHHQIFHVQKGHVRIRYIRNEEAIRKKKRKKELNIKSKPCWMLYNHPQKCPFTEDSCNFLHDDFNCK